VLRLTVRGAAGMALALQAGTYGVGSGPDNDLVLDDRAVSRLHAEIAVLDGRVRVRDLDSRNGSFCNGVRFREIEAGPGAVLRLGRTELVLESASRAAGEEGPESFGRLRGRSPAMRRVFALLERVAASDAPVLVRGETGTGKELCAEALHRHGPRSKGPFVVADLAGVSATLLESELFGHARGAFTGAVSDRAGAFERAEGGTVFLDEVGELPPELQPRLLRALENRQVKRVGANDYRRFDARIVAATHRDLPAECRAGRFREDLYHRLAVVVVELPPLRARPGDIPLLVERMLADTGRAAPLAPDTMALLEAYDWPGNVRELRNVVERAVSLGSADGSVPGDVLGLPGGAPAAAARPTGGAPPPYKEAREKLLAAFERDYLSAILDAHGGNVSASARAAGIDRVYLHRLMRKHGLD